MCCDKALEIHLLCRNISNRKWFYKRSIIYSSIYCTHCMHWHQVLARISDINFSFSTSIQRANTSIDWHYRPSLGLEFTNQITGTEIFEILLIRLLAKFGSCDSPMEFNSDSIGYKKRHIIQLEFNY